MKANKAVALRITQLLNKNKMTQYQLAKKMGVNRTTLGHIMREETTTILFNTLLRIADAFEMSIAEFLDDELFSRENIEFE